MQVLSQIQKTIRSEIIDAVAFYHQKGLLPLGAVSNFE